MNKKVTILLSVYKPNISWLKILLNSLNNQTYQNISLLICDDCPDYPVDRELISSLITNFKYKITANEKNLGSNKTFERLTAEADGDYFAYCDQDDIWEPRKIELLVKDLEKTNSVLSFSDMYVINESGKKIAESISDLRKRQKGISGDNLSPVFLTRNFISGCSMLIRADIAKEALPFVSYMIHDHWLALYASSKGYISFVNTPLIGYRLHSHNQTSVMMGVETKSDYLEYRIINPKKNILELKERFKNNERIMPLIEKTLQWDIFRERWWQSFDLKAAAGLFKYRKVNPFSTAFELVMARMPSFVFALAVRLIKSGKI